MTIDTSGLSEEQKATAEFNSIYTGMLRQLNAPGFIPLLCAHEAAHVVYYRMMGTTQFRPLPPRITCNAKTGKFIPLLAAVEIIDKPPCQPESWQNWLKMDARASVAGSVVARKLGSTDAGGEEGDRLAFNDDCAQLVAHFGGIPINTDCFWAWAQRSVEKDLEEFPDRMESIQTLALELQPQFGL